MMPQSNIMEIAAKMSPQGYDVPTAKTLGKKSFILFKDILDRSMNNTGADKASSENPPTDKSSNVVSGENSAVMGGGRDDAPIQRIQARSTDTVDRTKSGEKPLKAENYLEAAGCDRKADAVLSTDDGSEGNTRAEMLAVNVLASVLAIEPKELLKILDKLGIKASDILDGSKTTNLKEKLSAFMALDRNGSEMLGKVLEMVKNEVSSVFKQAEGGEMRTTSEEEAISAAAGKSDGMSTRVNPENVNAEVAGAQEFSELISKVKERLESLSAKLGQEPQTVLGGLARKVREVLAKELKIAENRPLKAESEASEAEGPELAEVKDNSKEKTDASAQTPEKPEEIKTRATLQENREKPQTEPLKPDAGVGVQKGPDQDGINTAIQQNILNGPQKTSDTGSVVNIYKPDELPKPVSRFEIISQVVEKAKVILSDAKSEMIMDLKPDFLGKLSLKVVTEHGAVTAKFTAENQQVKAVLESNMQLLKDALEKQGLSVQGFSVSVGQDSFRGFNGSQAERKAPGTAARRISIAGVNVPETIGRLEGSGTVNPYTWSSSSINLTA